MMANASSRRNGAVGAVARQCDLCPLDEFGNFGPHRLEFPEAWSCDDALRMDPRLVQDIGREIARTRARILHVHGYASSNFGRIAAKRAGIPLVLHEHFADPKMPWYQKIPDLFLRNLTAHAIGGTEHDVETERDEGIDRAGREASERKLQQEARVQTPGL